MGKFRKRYRRLRDEVEGLRLHAFSHSLPASKSMFELGSAEAYADLTRRMDAVLRANREVAE